jgi:hypothetical protein
MDGNRWPKEDEIKWIESERRRAQFDPGYRESPDALEVSDLDIWLAKTRDRKSWKEIGDSFYGTKGSKPEARRSEARRAYERIELCLRDRTAFEAQPQRKASRLRHRIKEVFGVSAEEFRAFILKGQLSNSSPSARARRRASRKDGALSKSR